MQKAIKEQNGDCCFTTEQEYNSVDDAVKDFNPITEMKIKIAELRVDNAKYKLKKNENESNNADSKPVANNPNNS